MKKNCFVKTFRCLFFFAEMAILGFPTHASEYLTLESYLSQVKDHHTGIKGALTASQGSELRSEEGTLLITPTAYANFQITRDARITPYSFLGYDNQVTKVASIGVSQLTTFGLSAKLHYDILAQNYVNPVFLTPGFSGIGIPFAYTNASPVLELNQSLWSNFLGRSTRANQTEIEAQALAASYGSSFQAKVDLSNAEQTYWKLALARQTVAVQLEALDRAQKIYEWNSRRAKLHLADASDAIQAEALVKTRELDLMSAKNLVRSASLAFNSDRNIDSDHVQEQLDPLHPKTIEEIRIPQRAALRDDVKAAQQSAKAAEANAVISLERDSPTLDVFASVALNGQPSLTNGVPQGYMAYPDLSDSLGSSFSFNRPTFTVGLKFSAPLDLGTVSKSRDGWRKEKIAAEMLYDRKVFDQEQSWKDLNQTLSEARQHLELSRKLETIQEAKLRAERNRLQQGRTTTYQVLLFEQDYLLAQLARIRDQANVFTIIAQMKLFGDAI